MKMDLLPYDQEGLLNNFPPALRKNFEELFANGKLGLSEITLNDISFMKQYTNDNMTFCYHYTLKIPFAGKKLSWEVIFDPEDISFAPDFNFNDETFYLSRNLDEIIENIPTLVSWNVNDSQAVASVLREFLNLFKKQQIENLTKENIYSQLSLEYQNLIKDVCDPNDVEVFLETSAAHFVIKIQIDVSTILGYLPTIKNNTDEFVGIGDDECCLRVSFMKLDGSRITSSLQLSLRLEQLLGGARILHIPNYSKQTTLTEYVTLVTKLVEDHVKKIEQHRKLKKDFVTCLSTMFANSLIQFDSETFSKAVFLFELDDYYCLVHIDIDAAFPQDKPTVTIYSLYCQSQKRTCSEIVKDYPYSPRWSSDAMLKRLINHLIDNAVPKFKTHPH